MASQSDGETLSLRNGVRCVTESSASVQDVLVAIAEQVGGGNIDSASRMNKAVVVFLKSVNLAAKLIASGIWVKDVFVQVTPLAAPATKVVISNVPPFIKNEAIQLELSRFGKFASAMKMIPLGCKSDDLKHVMSFRRHIFMFLKDTSQNLDVSFRVRHGDRSYVVFASTGSLRCFECGDIGHMRRSCPHKDKERNENAEDGNIPGAEEKASEEENGGSDGRPSGETETNEPSGEERGGLGVQEKADIDDPQEGTSASSTAQPPAPDSAERSGRPKEKGKGRLRRPWGEMEQSADRGKNKTGDGCTPEKRVGTNERVCDPAMETVGNSPGVEAHTADAEGEAEVVEREPGSNRAPSSMQGDEEEEGELSDSSVVSDITASQEGDGTFYSFEEISDYLDETKGKTVNIQSFFPDGEKFLRSVKHHMKTVGIDVLSSQKRFRLKKHCTHVRKMLAASNL